MSVPAKKSRKPGYVIYGGQGSGNFGHAGRPTQANLTQSDTSTLLLVPSINIYAKLARVDPTRTLVLRNNFAAQMTARFRKLKAIIQKAIIDDDCFGIAKPESQGRRIVVQADLTTRGGRSFDFPTSQEKSVAFLEWLKQQEQAGILETVRIPQVGTGIESAWTDVFIKDSYQRGVQRARDELLRGGYAVPSMEVTGGISASLMQPVHIDRLGMMYSRTFDGLKGITSAMDMQISHVLTKGLADGDGQATIAKKLLATIDGNNAGTLGITDSLGRFIPAERRAAMLARTEVIRAHAQGTLQEFKNWGVAGVDVLAEWITSGINVCPECQFLAANGPYTIEQAWDMLPAHPNCLCAWLARPIDGKEKAPVEVVSGDIGAIPQGPGAAAISEDFNYPPSIDSEMIADYPADFKDISMEQFMAQATWDDIQGQMKVNLDAIRGKVPFFEEPTDPKAIVRNMKSELESYTHYLAGDTVSLMRDLIDDYAEIMPGLGSKVALTDLNALGNDMIKKLIYQEIESNRRQFTDHGIRHLVNNWKMADKMLGLLEVTAPMDRLETMFIMVNHDVGYTTPLIREGGLRGVLTSKYHKLFSETIAEAQKDLWDVGKIFGERQWGHALDLIKTHDSFDMTISAAGQLKDPMAAAVRLSDNLAQFWSEKLPSMFRYVEGSQDILVQMMEASGREDKTLFHNLQIALREKIDESHLSPLLKRDLFAAVGDINYLTPKYALPTLAGEVSRTYGSIESAIVVEIQHNQMDIVLQQMFDLGQKRVKGLLEDFGFDNFNKSSYKIGQLADGRSLFEIRILGAPSGTMVDDKIAWNISKVDYKGVGYPSLTRGGQAVGQMSEDWIIGLNDYAKMHKISLEEAVEKLEIKLQQLTKDAGVWVRRTERSFEQILADKGMKNQYDVGRSSGFFNPSGRKKYEQVLWGAPDTLSNVDRPIYGYLASDKDGIGVWGSGTFKGNRESGVAQYGGIAFKLKDSARARTTFNFGDSLDDYRKAVFGVFAGAPSPINQPGVATVGEGMFGSIDKMKSVNDLWSKGGLSKYVESQIWGGVRLKDIEEIVFPTENLYNKYADQLEKLGVKARWSRDLGVASRYPDPVPGDIFIKKPSKKIVL